MKRMILTTAAIITAAILSFVNISLTRQLSDARRDNARALMAAQEANAAYLRMKEANDLNQESLNKLFEINNRNERSVYSCLESAERATELLRRR